MHWVDGTADLHGGATVRQDALVSLQPRLSAVQLVLPAAQRRLPAGQGRLLSRITSLP